MQTDTPASPQSGPAQGGIHELREIVMGLHWDPPVEGAGTAPDDLDALCVLFDGEQRVLEVIHPGHPRNANASVVHTGDSKDGASTWDDERIFVFLEALPAAVSALGFVVSSTSGRAFSEITGASCHVSDHLTETAWIRIDLTSLKECVAHSVATLSRSATGWTLSAGTQFIERKLLAELQSVAREGKTRTGNPQPGAAA